MPKMTKDEAVNLFRLAGFAVTKTWELVNGYGAGPPRCECCGSWWLLRTELGLVEIGWRKCVISIDWSDTPVKLTNFPEADAWVTHGDDYTHAHGPAKALEYLTLLKKAADRVPREDRKGLVWEKCGVCPKPSVAFAAGEYCEEHLPSSMRKRVAELEAQARSRPDYLPEGVCPECRGNTISQTSGDSCRACGGSGEESK